MEPIPPRLNDLKCDIFQYLVRKCTYQLHIGRERNRRVRRRSHSV